MTFFYAILLGIVQGLTEFIPVSSTAHLLIAEKILGVPADDRTFAFSVIIQLGTVLALVAFFWKEIWQITQAFFLGIKQRNPFENLQARLGWLIIVATLPALIAGFLLEKYVKTLFHDPLLMSGVRLLFSSILLTAAEYFSRRVRRLDSATWLDALSVGLFQVLAIFPGASRSATTIAGGMFRGFDRPSAARFAFLMSAPVLIAAGAYETLKIMNTPNINDLLPHLAVGFMVAAIVGWISIKWLLAYLGKHSLYIFAAYCALLGAVVLFVHFR